MWTKEGQKVKETDLESRESYCGMSIEGKLNNLFYFWFEDNFKDSIIGFTENYNNVNKFSLNYQSDCDSVLRDAIDLFFEFCLKFEKAVKDKKILMHIYPMCHISEESLINIGLRCEVVENHANISL